jgi:hypothetical protein
MVTSPGFPIGYANNLICRWVLTTDPHYRVAMTLITLDMEAGSCMFDRVEINNGGLFRYLLCDFILFNNILMLQRMKDPSC